MPHRGEQRLLITTSKRHKGDSDLVLDWPQSTRFSLLYPLNPRSLSLLQSGLDLLVQLSPARNEQLFFLPPSPQSLLSFLCCENTESPLTSLLCRAAPGTEVLGTPNSQF